MPLVADYGSGSSGEDNSEDEDVPQQQPANVAKTVISSSMLTSKAQPFVKDDSSEDEDEDDPSSSIGQFLPKPKTKSNLIPEEELDNGPIPPKKTYGDEEKPPAPSSFPNIVAKKVKGVVRIAAPSLKDFENDAPDDKGKSARFVQSMIKKGSGLFAILPEPRGGNLSREVPMSFLKTKVSPVPVVQEPTPMPTPSSISSSQASSSTSKSMLPRSLIPDSVKNLGKRPPPSKLDEIRAKYMKQEANVVIVSSGRSKSGEISTPMPKVRQDSDDSWDEEESAPNFFSFGSGAAEIDEETLEKLKLPMPDFSQLPSSSVSTLREDNYEDDIQDDDATISTQAVHQQDFMQYVQKKKGKGGREEINFIDVKQDDLKPDSTEWVKHLTDGSAVPVRRGKGLGGMQKRKHQITYLAVEAKAREQELQQQWAAGRANRRQTKMKYGF